MLLVAKSKIVNNWSGALFEVLWLCLYVIVLLLYSVKLASNHLTAPIWNRSWLKSKLFYPCRPSFMISILCCHLDFFVLRCMRPSVVCFCASIKHWRSLIEIKQDVVLMFTVIWSKWTQTGESVVLCIFNEVIKMAVFLLNLLAWLFVFSHTHTHIKRKRLLTMWRKASLQLSHFVHQDINLFNDECDHRIKK